MSCSAILLILAIGMGVSAAIMPYPWHASCAISWQLQDNCQTFKTKLINQIQAWEGDSLCPSVSASCAKMPCGQKCLYEFVADKDNTITATHKTPVARYIDDLTFTLKDKNGKCDVEAKSSSRLWYAVLDMGTNYCNLRNLLDGAGYTEENLTEVTEDSVCTQYTSRDCTRF